MNDEIIKNNKIKEIDELLHSIIYKFNDYYKLSYLEPRYYSKAIFLISRLRLLKEIDGDNYYRMMSIYRHYADNYWKIKNLIRQEPRTHAQRFIGRNKIREFIFKRDKYTCLCCGSKDKLSIDHISPINNGGGNKLSNLQTLCKSCNSRKSTNYIDYR